MRQVSFLRAPVFVWWNITLACNLKCKQCYSASGKPHPNELNTEEAKQLIRELGDMRVFYIYFLGGEPLQRKDFFELLAYTRDCRMAAMLSTNGWFITPDIAKRLEQLDVMHARVSIDGATAATHDAIRGVSGSFERAINAVRYLKQTTIPRVGISHTVLADNIGETESLIQQAVDLGVDEMQLVQLCNRGRAQKSYAASIDQLTELRQLFARYRKQLTGVINLSATDGIYQSDAFLSGQGDTKYGIWGCPGTRTRASIEAEGTVQPCILNTTPAGNVREQSFAEIWQTSPVFVAMRTVAPECERCHYADVCARECPVDSCMDANYRRGFAKCSQRGGDG